MAGVEGVDEVHDLHVWSLSSEVRALSAHLVLSGHPTLEEAQLVGERVKRTIGVPFAIAHATLELECESCFDGVIPASWTRRCSPPMNHPPRWMATITMSAMATESQSQSQSRTRLERRAEALCRFSVGWNAVEGGVAIAAGVVAGSVALTSWGIDSIIEVFTAILVLVHLRGALAGREANEAQEQRFLKLIAGTFFALALYVVVDSTITLVSAAHPETSPVGIAMAGAATVVMPLLAVGKRRIGRALNNPLVLADSDETMLCAALSVSTLVGLLAWTLIGWSWLDPVVGYLIAYFCVREGREAWAGELVCTDDHGDH